jgi:hypothetical protein
MRKFIIGLTAIAVLAAPAAASASTGHTTKSKAKVVRCHGIVNGKKSWSSKFCPVNGKSGKLGVKGKDGTNGVNGKDGFNGANGGNGATGLSGKDGTNGKQGDQGIQGNVGPAGANGRDGVSGYEVRTADYFRDESYPGVGPGGVATVACSSENKVAISGGFWVRDGADTKMDAPLPSLTNGTGIVASFPGRMDWSTNRPKVNRNDGWIIRFNSNTVNADVTLYAICINAA